ncbi:MAG: alpha-2-macroglobulin family protein [Myxococcota bacterium]
MSRPRPLFVERAGRMAVLGLLAVSLAGCPRETVADGEPGGREESDAAASAEETLPEEELEGEGLFFRVTDARPGGEAAEPVPVAEGKPLGEAAAERLLSRLPPLVEEEGDRKTFAKRKRSKPAPRAGETVETPFPPPSAPEEAPGEVESGPLEVLRHQPEGEVPLAPHLSVTFSQPMIPVTSHGELAAEEVPVRVEPEPPGTWRWVGTRTLLFEPDDRFPMATAYTAEVPAGTESATGGALAEAATWSFGTPAPRLVGKWPTSGPQRRDVPMFLAFDQRIDPEAVMDAVAVEAGGEPVEVRLLDAAEARAHESLRGLAERAEEGRWLTFRPVRRLPADAGVTVTVGPGTPSAEGPRTTDEAQSFAFRTYGPFRVIGHRCGWSDECRPGWDWRIELSNPVDAESLSDDMVTVEPDLPGLNVAAWGRNLQVRGRSRARTTYTVTLDPGLRDAFGQTLGESEPISFEVGAAAPGLAAQGDLMVVLEPRAKKRFPVLSVNYPKLEVRVWRVEPGDWGGFLAHVRTVLRRDGERAMPGEKVVDRVVEPGGEPDRLTETWIDLAPALEGGHGHAVVEVQPPASLVDKLKGRRPPVIRRWVQVTDLGVDAFVDQDEMVAWVNRLEDGGPVEGATVALQPGGGTAKTDAEGLARLPLLAGGGEGARGMVVAERGGDRAMLLEHTWLWGDRTSWYAEEPSDSLRWYAADDRHLYKPGETVRVKGWLRRVGGGPDGDVGALDGAAETVAWTIHGPRGNELGKGSERLDALGGFHLSFDLPDDVNLGTARLSLRAEGGSLSGGHTHAFRVEEFRRPEFEVSVRKDEGPHLVGGHGVATVRAGYYAGGPLPAAETSWTLTSTPGEYVPPNRDDWTFGIWRPWWRSFAPSGEERTRTTWEGRTDATGEHAVRVDFRGVKPPRPFRLEAQATVMDVNRQAWTGRTALLVHPGALYVGVKTPSTFVQPGEPIHVDALAVDLEGRVVAGRPVEIEVARLAWRQRKGEWREEEVDRQACEVTSTADEDGVRCSFTPKAGGRHRVRATVRDARGRRNRTERIVWVPGGERPPSRNIEEQEVQVVPDRERYAPGDVAGLLVQAPFSPAEGLLTVRRSGLVHTERFTMEGTSTTLRVPIEEGHVPNVHVAVDLVGQAPRVGPDGEPLQGEPLRPAFASGGLNLKVPPRSRTLDVTATPASAEMAPGGETVVDLLVEDAAGEPVSGAQVAVVVVDEAVLALTGYEIPDPVDVFYSERSAGVSEHRSRRHVLLGEVDLAQAPEMEEAEQSAGVGGAQGMADEAARAPMARRALSAKAAPAAEPEAAAGGDEAIAVREDFDALAVFAPDVRTDAEGRARVDVTLPDNLTRYRVTAVAAAGEREFGKGESTLTARLPLMVRPSPPRFLNYGDRFELPVVLQNQTDEAMAVSVAARATVASLGGPRGWKVSVPARDRVEVRFPTETESAGTARFQVAAASGPVADAARVELPVWTPATTEAFATYGAVDEGTVFQPVRAPEDAIPEFGGLEVTTSSTQLQALTDAFLYLVGYPFDCAEQLASRILGVAALKDVLAAFEAEGLPEPEEIRAAVARDVERLRRLQNGDGGWGFWRRGQRSVPFLTVHVSHALVRAADKGFEVDDRMRRRALGYLARIEEHFPSHYPEAVRRVITAYGLYVRDKAGDADPERARGLVEEAGGLEELPLEAVGWIYPVLAGEAGSEDTVEDIRRHLGNRVTETAAAAHFTTGYDDGAHLLLHSSRRADALILEALVGDRPGSDLIPKIVRGLLAHRKEGRWGNTQDNVFVLLALDRYFHAYESVTPDFVARIWLGDRYAGEHRFEGRTTEREHLSVPMATLKEAEGEPPLVLQKEGKGRMYYRLGLRYAPEDLDLEPADHGFTVERRYEPVDDPGDVRRDDDGTWHVRPGARVRVRVTMVAPTRRYHVALVDPLPAGLEPVNPDLAVSATPPPGDEEGGRSGYWRWWGPWYEHDNLRDERAEAFSSLVWEGVHTYTYVARATTPGRFVVPPPKAEEMYHPETFGRGATARVVIDDRE